MAEQSTSDRLYSSTSLFLKKFAEILKQIVSTQESSTKLYVNSQKYLTGIEKKQLDTNAISNIIKKVYNTITPRLGLFDKRDISVFNIVETTGDKQVKVTVLPGIDLEQVFKSTSTSEVLDQLWDNVYVLYISASKLLYFSNKDMISKESLQFVNKHTIKYDPYDGFIGSSDDLTTDQLMESINKIEKPDQLKGLLNMVGIDQAIDMKQLSQNLSSISTEDFSKATDNMMKMMGMNNDKNNVMNKCIRDMMTNLQEELKDPKYANSEDTIGAILEISKKSAAKVLPTVDQEQIKKDAESLINNTSNIAENFNKNVMPELSKEKQDPKQMNQLNMLMGMMQKMLRK